MQKTGIMTRKGQVTIPANMRRELELAEGDRVAFALVDDEIRIRRIGSVAAMTAGALAGGEPSESAERLREMAEEAIAEDVRSRTNVS
ncbi:hypothetical protein BH23CHL2_BH23CHL2_14320 [soil metagenome]